MRDPEINRKAHKRNDLDGGKGGHPPEPTTRALATVAIHEKPALGKRVELGDLLPKGYQTASCEVGRLLPENIAEFRAYKNLSEVERRLLAHIAATDKDDAGEWVRVLCIKDCLAMAPGTPVLLLADDLRIVATQTTRKPRDFGGQPVVDLEGFEHPYAMRLVYVRGRFARRIGEG